MKRNRGKSRSASKAPRKTRTKSRPRRKSVAARRPARTRSAKTAAPKSADTLDAMIDATTAALALPVDAAWKPAIRSHLQVTLAHAMYVSEFALPDDAEPAPVFRA